MRNLTTGVGLTMLALGSLLLPVTSDAADNDVAATVGSESISRAAVEAAVQPALVRSRREHATQVQQLDFELAQREAKLIESEIDQRLDDRVLQLESSATKLTRQQLLDRLKPVPTTPADVRAFYEAHRRELNQPFERVDGQIYALLVQQSEQSAQHEYLQSLRRRYHAVNRTEPLRLAVAATGPARGPASAPVTLVEFADFQCPYCAQMEPVIAELLAAYPRELRVIYRHLPLTDLHPQAAFAARAAVCADGQQRFWDLHDALFRQQATLGEDAIKATAQRIGLDATRFTGCLADPASASVVDADAAAADALGLGATPAFLINGRYLGGTVPARALREIIDDELARAKAPRSGAAGGPR